MSISWHPPVQIVSYTDTDLSGGVASGAVDARNLYRLSFYVLWSHYTSVTVKLQGTLDGTTWSDIQGFSITSSGNIISGEIGPYKSIRIFSTATSGVSPNTLSAYLQMTSITR